MTTQDRIRAAGGDVYHYGAVIFESIEQFLAACQVPAGWQLVPVEPTPEMKTAGHAAANDDSAVMCGFIYRAMLAASPGELPIQKVPEGWQPIETAPKDGTSILLVNNSGVSEGSWHSDMDHGADWEGQIGLAGFCRADGKDQPNTHWMPLPEAPEATPPTIQKAPLTEEQRCRITAMWSSKSRNYTVSDIIDAVEAAHNIMPATGTQEAP